LSVLSKELVSCHPSGANDTEVASRFFENLGTTIFTSICGEIPIVVEIGHKYVPGTLYLKTYVCFGAFSERKCFKQKL